MTQAISQQKLCASRPMSESSSTVSDVTYTTNNSAICPPVDLIPSCHGCPCHPKRKASASLQHAWPSHSKRARVSSVLLHSVSKITPRQDSNQTRPPLPTDLPIQQAFSWLQKPCFSICLSSPMPQTRALLGGVDLSRRQSLVRTPPRQTYFQLNTCTDSGRFRAYDNIDENEAAQWQYANASPSLATRAFRQRMERTPTTSRSGSLGWDMTTTSEDSYHSPNTPRHSFDFRDFINLTPSPHMNE